MNDEGMLMREWSYRVGKQSCGLIIVQKVLAFMLMHMAVGLFLYTGFSCFANLPCKKATIHQLTTSQNVLFPGHNHLLTTSADDPSL